MTHQARRYIAGIDESELAMTVLDEAMDAALEHEAELHCIFVHQLLGSATNLYDGPDEPAMHAALERLAPRVREQIRRFGGEAPVVRLHGIVGPAAETLVVCAAVLGAQRIFVGTHGRTGLSRALLGSVAESVVRNAGCSVTVVRNRDHSPDACWPPNHRQLPVQ